MDGVGRMNGVGWCLGKRRWSDGGAVGVGICGGGSDPRVSENGAGTGIVRTKKGWKRMKWFDRVIVWLWVWRIQPRRKRMMRMVMEG